MYLKEVHYDSNTPLPQARPHLQTKTSKPQKFQTKHKKDISGRSQVTSGRGCARPIFNHFRQPKTENFYTESTVTA